MVGGGPSTSTSTRASSGLEQGNQGICTGVMSEPMPTSQTQFWQAWAQMRMAASPASYTQWQSAAGSSQIPSWAISSQVPVHGQSMDSSTTAEFSQAAQPNMDGSEHNGPYTSMNSERNSPASLHAQQVHLKQWIEVLEKQLSSAIERQTQHVRREAPALWSKQLGRRSEHFAVISLINCRQLLQPRLSQSTVGFYHSALMNTHHINKETDFWDLVKRCSGSLNDAMRNRKHFTDMGDLNYLMFQAIQHPGSTPSCSMRTSLLVLFQVQNCQLDKSQECRSPGKVNGVDRLELRVSSITKYARSHKTGDQAVTLGSRVMLQSSISQAWQVMNVILPVQPSK
ncbi:unnamed protein product [Calypogeia fissa]